MKYTHILWDFNGTLLDDINTGIKSINTLLQKRGKKTVETIEEYHAAFTFPITDYYKNVGFDLEAEPFDDIAREWIEENQENIKNAELFDDALFALDCFREANIPQVMISATKQDLLLGHVCSLGIRGYFEEILGLDNINAESKAGIAIDWKKRHQESNPVFIGDTVHDADVACAIGCDCLLVSTGHQSKRTLELSGIPVFSCLKEITAYLLDTR